MSERSDKRGRSPGRQPAEGVRIIRAEEAQAALDAGEATGRRPEDQLRFGDVPPVPAGPRPAHRFPLPDSVDPAEAVPIRPISPSRADESERSDPAEGWGNPPREWDVGDRTAEIPETSLGSAPPAHLHLSGADDPARPEAAPSEAAPSEYAPAHLESPGPPAPDYRAGPRWEAPRSPDPVPPPRSSFSEDPSPSHPGETLRAYETSRASEDPTQVSPVYRAPSPASSALEPPEEGITVTGGVAELPHWTDPPTGEVPRILVDDSDDDPVGDDDLEAWRALGARGVRWRDGEDDWDEGDEMADLAGDEEPMGVLDQSRSEESDVFSFDEEFERVTSRTGGVAVVTDFDEGSGEGPDESWQAPLEAPRRRRAEAAAGDTATRTRTRPRLPAGRDGRARPGRPGRQTGGGDDMGSRVGVGIGLVVVLVIAYIVGPKALIVLSALVILAAAAEAFGMLQRAGFRPATLLGLVATLGVVFGAYWKGLEALPLAAVLVFAGSMMWYVLGIVEARPLANVAVTMMVFVWVGVLGSFAGLLLSTHKGKNLFLGALIVAVAADVAAFAVGRAIGSRPMAEHISPNKTVEGFSGGLLVAIVAGAIVGKELAPWGGMTHGLILGIVIGLIAPMGDLFESMMKRDLGVKDSGTILPGHGGLLDRFDSILLALPAVYYLSVLFKI